LSCLARRLCRRWFDTIGGQTRNNIAALDAASGGRDDLESRREPADTDDPSLSVVNALGRLRWTIYAGGSFPSISEQGRQYLAALRATPAGNPPTRGIRCRQSRAADSERATKWGNLR